jgi:tetratricopeptide (TPR) repeat protein
LEIERELGRGAFARVLRAHDTVIDRLVALKVVHAPGDEAERDRVLREARAVGQLNSPHIVTLYRVHGPDEEGTWVFEMEYVAGGTLAELLERETHLVAPRAVKVARGIATALRAAHEAEVVHGDVKPGNVLLAREGAVKLADFGLAHLLGDQSLTGGASGLVGTPVFMAPEVIMGERPAKASDIWSFGVVLYRMLAGRQPFEGRSLPALFYAIEQGEPPPLEPSTPAGLARLVARCLSKQPWDRPGSFTEILAYLEAGPSAPVQVSLPTPAPEVADTLLGRARELETLSHLIAGAAQGTGATILVTGEAGTGKTALARHARKVAAGRGFPCIEATITPLRGLLRPLLEATRGLIDSGMVPHTASELFGSASDLARRLLDEEVALKLESRSQTLWSLEQLLGGLAGEFHPLVLIEDAQHADTEDLRLLEHLALRLPTQGILLLITCGTDEAAVAGTRLLAARSDMVHLALEPLSREDTYRHLKVLGGVRHVAPEVAQRVFSITQGNPLFTIELYRHLDGTNTVACENDALLPGPTWTESGLPRRFKELCAARLKGLTEEEIYLIDVAAVDGLQTDGETLAAVLNEPLLTVLRRLQRLYRAQGFLAPGPEGYRFWNPLLQQFIYQDLAPELRREIHLSIARHLETRTADVDPERIGQHWERGGERGRALPYLRRAALAAAQRQEVTRAIDLARRAGVVPGRIEAETARAEGGLILQLSGCYYGSGRPEEGVSLLDDLMQATADEELRLRAFVQKAHLEFSRRGPSPADEAELRRAAEVLPDAEPRGKAYYLLGLIAKYRGELDIAERRLRAADDLYRALELESSHSSALDQLASVALRRGKLREAEALYGDAARIAAHAGRRSNAAASRVNACLAALRQGRLEGAAQTLEGCITELDLEGAQNLSAHATVHLARVRYAEGDLPRAVRAAADAVGRLEQTSFLPGLVPALYTQAYLAAAEGRLNDALVDLERARAAATRSEARAPLLIISGLGALVATWSGDARAAEAAAKAGLEATPGRGLANAELVLLLAEGGLYGLAPPCLAEARALLPADDASENVVIAAAHALIAGIQALSEGDLPAARSAAQALAGDRVGEDRAALRIAGTYLEAEALARAGEPAQAERLADRGAEAARSLGHVWLELLLRASLARLNPGGRDAERLEECVECQARAWDDPEERARFRRAWGSR